MYCLYIYEKIYTSVGSGSFLSDPEKRYSKRTFVLGKKDPQYFLLWRCGGSLVPHQNSGAEVLGSNPASPIQ